jgi:3-phenylpropionate/cinnamic acid dioxygenase small subunit
MITAKQVPDMIDEVAAADLDEGTRNAITQLHYRFGAALDTNDWDLYRSCLDDPITAHYEGAGLPRVTTSADDWTAFVRAAVEVQQTVHYFTNLMATRTSDGRVACRLNHQSCHRVDTHGAGDSTHVQYGVYRTVAVERDGRWLLAEIHHTVSWSVGNPSLVDSGRPAFRHAYEAVFTPADH